MANQILKARLEHINDAIEKIEAFIDNLTEADFLKDEKTQSAILYQFLIIGEAVRHIDVYLLEKYPYPWHIPKSFRNYIAHEYHKINLERVFFASQDLSSLKEMVQTIITREFTGNKI